MLGFLPEVLCFWPDDKTGEFRCAVLEILPTVPGLASVVRAREESKSAPAIPASRLLETAGLLDDPLDRITLEPDIYNKCL